MDGTGNLFQTAAGIPDSSPAPPPLFPQVPHSWLCSFALHLPFLFSFHLLSSSLFLFLSFTICFSPAPSPSLRTVSLSLSLSFHPQAPFCLTDVLSQCWAGALRQGPGGWT